jgi:hypothetical protein
MRKVLLSAAIGLLIFFSGCKDDSYVAPWPQNAVEVRDYDETTSGGLLRVKAVQYDAWHLKWHQPYYGGTVEVDFADDARTVMSGVGGYGDSCIWTGTYLGSQAMRYYVTGDPTAKENAIRMVDTLDGYLHVTGKEGFIARYHAPQDSLGYRGDAACDASDSCHRVETGTYAGDFWEGNTSRDQYTGWFFGMALAYDLIDDDAVKIKIRADVKEVVTALMDNNWNITAQDGKPSKTAPQVQASMKLNFLVIGYHMTGDARMLKQLKSMLLNVNRSSIFISDINFLNQYLEYYGNNLAHTNWYNLLRLGKVYFGEDDYNWLVSEFNKSVHTFTKLSHNAWFNGIYMSQGGWINNMSPTDPYYSQLVEDLSEFRDAPNGEYYLPDRDPSTYTIDPQSVRFHNLFEALNIESFWKPIDIQADKAFPVPLQCPSDFLWQRNPFVITACGSDNPKHVNPGVDYLVSYWLGSYHKFLNKGM